MNTKKTTYSISALDTLFFRDGRPFTMGDNSWANHLFPPYPSTLYGMFRSVFFEGHMDNLHKVNSYEDPTKELQIQFIGLQLIDEDNEDILLFPVPLDLVKDKSKNELYPLDFIENNNSITKNNLPYKLNYQGNGKVTDPDNFHYITEDQLNAYLNGKAVAQSTDIKDYMTTEVKIGLGRNPQTGRPEDGHLYRMTMQRLQKDTSHKIRLVCSISGLELPEENVHRLGGEGKLVFTKKSNPVSTSDKVSVDTYFKLYLATPAIFKDGWQPKSLLHKYNLEIVGASIGTPLPIGGWDIIKRQPKPMLQAVPPGSVYYLTGTKEDIDQFQSAYHGKNLYQDWTEDTFHYQYAKQGFGLTYIGKI